MVAETPEPPSIRPARLAPGEPLETVCGVPLEAGERVVVFARPDHSRAKLLHILVGVLLVPLLVGIPLIVYAVLYERWQLRYVAVTTKRVIEQVGLEPARWLALDEIVQLRAKSGEDAARTLVVEGARGALVVEDAETARTIRDALGRARADRAYLASLPTANYPA